MSQEVPAETPFNLELIKEGDETIMHIGFNEGRLNIKDINQRLRVEADFIPGPKSIFFDLSNVQKLGIAGQDIFTGMMNSGDAISVMRDKSIKYIAFCTGANAPAIINAATSTAGIMFSRERVTVRSYADFKPEFNLKNKYFIIQMSYKDEKEALKDLCRWVLPSTVDSHDESITSEKEA